MKMQKAEKIWQDQQNTTPAVATSLAKYGELFTLFLQLLFFFVRLPVFCSCFVLVCHLLYTQHADRGLTG